MYTKCIQVNQRDRIKMRSASFCVEEKFSESSLAFGVCFFLFISREEASLLISLRRSKLNFISQASESHLARIAKRRLPLTSR